MGRDSCRTSTKCSHCNSEATWCKSSGRGLPKTQVHRIAKQTIKELDAHCMEQLALHLTYKHRASLLKKQNEELETNFACHNETLGIVAKERDDAREELDKVDASEHQDS